MKFKNLIFATIACILLFNCSHNGGGDLSEIPATVTYNGSVKAIISNNCNRCHGNPTSNGAPISFVTYDQVKNNIDNILGRINNVSDPMPQSGLMPIENRNLIQKWKDDGLLEN